MDIQHKARIAELEAKAPGTPLVEKEAQTQALRSYAGIVEVHIKEAQKLINDAGEAWMHMEDIDDLVKVWEQLQATQHKVDALTDTLKDLPPIQIMLKMGESTKLQAKMQKLRVKQVHFTKTLQPWKARLSDIAIKVTEKLSHTQQMQTEVTSLMEQKLTVDLVDATKETVEQITKEIMELHAEFIQLNNEMWDATHPVEAKVVFSRMSHK